MLSILPPSLDLYTVYHFIPQEPVERGIQFVVGKCGQGSRFAHDQGLLSRTFGAHRCHYDVWKRRLETEAEYVGFQEYRRRFAHIPTQFDFDVAVFPRIGCSPGTIATQFISCHGAESWSVLLSALDSVGDGRFGTEINWIVPWDCIISKKLFAESMDFWWKICQFMLPRLNIPAEGYASRLLSFLSDRIFMVWLARRRDLVIREIEQVFLPHDLGTRNESTVV